MLVPGKFVRTAGARYTKCWQRSQNAVHGMQPWSWKTRVFGAVRNQARCARAPGHVGTGGRV